MMTRIFFFIAFCSFLWVSCTKENNAPAIDLQSDFYPLQVGSVSIYDVDSTSYNLLTKGNYKFELKDTITNTFTDLTGQTIYRIERYKKPIGSTDWQFQLV